MQEPDQPVTERTNKDVIIDYVKEVTGFERGFVRTVVDLRKQPDVVLQSYLKKEPTYIGPFRLLFSALGVWLFISAFVIDWYQVWGDLMGQYVEFLKGFFDIPPDKVGVFDQQMGKVVSAISSVGGDLFSKLYIPLMVVVLPVSAWLAERSCRRYNITYRSLLVCNTYVMAMNSAILVVYAICFAISGWMTLVISVVLLAITVFGKNVFLIVPFRRFFAENGKEIEKKMMIANIKTVFFFVFVIMGVYLIKDMVF